jgi:hypothetical protein
LLFLPIAKENPARVENKPFLREAEKANGASQDYFSVAFARWFPI